MKILGLIQKWGLNFEDRRSALPNFFNVYNKLRMNNVQFPSNFESNYQVYIDSDNNYKNNYEKNSDNDDNREEGSDKEDDEIFYYMDSLKNVLKVPNFEHKYRRLVNYLVKMHDNIQMANLLMDNKEHGGLKEIINTLREGNNTLIDTIQGGRLKDEKLMEITLGTTEDINQTLGREEDIRNGYKPNKFKSYFIMNNVIRIKSNKNNNHRNRAKSTKPKKNIQKNQEKYGMENNYYDKNKYKEKMGPKNVDDIFDLFSASNPNNEPQYNQNNNRGNNNNSNNINNFFNASQTQQLRNNPMNNFFNNNNRGNNMNNNMNNRNNNTMFFNQNNNQYNQPRPVMTNFDILEQKLNNLNIEQNQNNYNNMNINRNMPNMQYNQGYNNNNNNNRNNNNNLMSMLEQLGPGPQNNSNQLVPYIGSFNNQNNNMNQNNFMNNTNNNQYNNNFGNNMNNNMNNNNQFNSRNIFNSQVINRGNNMQINNNDNQINMNKINMSQNLGNNNNWMNQNNNQNNQQMNFEEMQKQQRLKELDDLF